MKIPIPARDWLRARDRAWLRADSVAAITLFADLLPAGLRSSSLAKLPSQAGFYARWFGWTFQDLAIYVITANDERPLSGRPAMRR